jgi:hypothetical protein
MRDHGISARSINGPLEDPGLPIQLSWHLIEITRHAVTTRTPSS